MIKQTMKNSIITLALFGILDLAPSASAQQFNTIYTFPNYAAGDRPDGTPYIGADGVIFGVTDSGGQTPCGSLFSTGCGTVFSLSPPVPSGGPWAANVLYTFQPSPDGAIPDTGVIPGPNGTLLGTTSAGGPANKNCRYGCGTFFQLTQPAQAGGNWTEQILYDYLRVDYMAGALATGVSGAVFGASPLGGNQACSLGCGSIYELLPPVISGQDWSLTAIHQFAPSTGAYPYSPLIVDANGVVYGTTEDGGDSQKSSCAGCGTVFALTPPVPPATTWGFQDIYRFHGGSDGFYPLAGLTMGPGGVLYGTTQNGGIRACASNLGCGTVFSLTPPGSAGSLWTKTILYEFLGGAAGSNPTSGVVTGPGGVLYGTTPEGGGTGCFGPGCGVLYQLTPPSVSGGSWTESILHTFTGGADGQTPYSSPAIDSTGVLYGFAYGGSGTACSGAGCGVVYQYIP
jgi:hypothetical protein